MSNADEETGTDTLRCMQSVQRHRNPFRWRDSRTIAWLCLYRVQLSVQEEICVDRSGLTGQGSDSCAGTTQSHRNPNVPWPCLGDAAVTPSNEDFVLAKPVRLSGERMKMFLMFQIRQYRAAPNPADQIGQIHDRKFLDRRGVLMYLAAFRHLMDACSSWPGLVWPGSPICWNTSGLDKSAQSGQSLLCGLGSNTIMAKRPTLPFAARSTESGIW